METTEPVNFVNVESLRPDQSGINVHVKVVDSKPLPPSAGGVQFAEWTVADTTACIIFTARGDQVDAAVPGAVLTVTAAKVEMFKGSMRLVTGQSGKVDVDKDMSIEKVNLDLNMSKIEYELVPVPS